MVELLRLRVLMYCSPGTCFHKGVKAPMNPRKAPTRPLDGSQIDPMRCREVPTRLPYGSQMAKMKPQDAPWSPPGDIREAFVYANRELCVFTLSLYAFRASLHRLTLTFKISYLPMVSKTYVVRAGAMESIGGIQFLNIT